MIKTLTKLRIAKHRLLWNVIFLLLSLCIVNSSFAAEDFPWEIFYPAFIKKSIDKDKDGFTKEQGDCNDSDPSINPDATEICDDGIDNDCNGEVDEGCGTSTISGYWKIINTTNDDSGYIQLQQSDGNISGTFLCGDSETITGSINGTQISFSWTENEGSIVTCTGTVSGDTISGTWTETEGREGAWTAESLTEIPAYTPSPYFPVTLGTTWTYDIGGTVEVTQAIDNTCELEVTISNHDDSGYATISITEDTIESHNFTNPNFIMLNDYLSPGTLLKLPITYGDSWVDTEISNGYEVTINSEITGVGMSIQAGGITYNGVVELTQSFNYPNGYDWSNPVTMRKMYFVQNVGCIKRITIWTNSTTTTIDLVSYNIK